MSDRPAASIVHPVLRVLAGFGCIAFLVLGVLFFPLSGLPENPWRLATPLSAMIGAVVGAVFCGRLAATGRWPRKR